jgi:hypothetical protein
MAECMISLLRGTINAKNSDVKLYLKNYDGLMYKMQSVDPALISEEAININERTLETII